MRVYFFIISFYFFIAVSGHAATGTSDDVGVLSQEAQRFIGEWKGDVKFNNEHRHWVTKRKRDYSAEYQFKVCEESGDNCKEWNEMGAWNADENYFYSIFSVDKDGNPQGHVYKYTVLENNCIEFIQVATSYQKFIALNGKEYNTDKWINKYKFIDCRVN